MRISISAKLILTTVSILLASTAAITYFSTQYFEEKSSEQVDFTNLESASSKAKELDYIVLSIIESVKTQAETLAKNKDEPQTLLTKPLWILQNFELTNGIYKMSSEAQNLEQVQIDKFDAEAFKSEINQLTSSTTHFDPKVKVEAKASLQGIPYGIITLPTLKDRSSNIIRYSRAIFPISLLTKPFQDSSTRMQFLVDANGKVLAHPEENRIGTDSSTLNNPFLKKVVGKNAQQFQQKIFDANKNESFFGAAVKTAFDAQVISLTSEKVILEVSEGVRRKAFFISGSAVSLAFFFVFVFSLTLSSPIEKLAILIQQVKKGNFDIHARKVVTSHDEVGDLASAFDQMTVGLKERDKVKTLFSKFHGSSVAENLLSNEIGVSGQNKDVIVFFSDIRGFTAFSEKRTPEAVVSMLNEYFAEMVSVINRNEGVVDKFIGDAIMAVWGAPKSGPHDARNAVMACLEMRKALDGLNRRRLARGEQAINIGMGLHAGVAISGTIGSNERMEYTVIGNTVNTASRVEASTKAFGADLLITQEVVTLVGDFFKVEEVGAAEVKGRSEALKMYKVLGHKLSSGEWAIVKTPYSDYTPEGADKVKIAASPKGSSAAPPPPPREALAKSLPARTPPPPPPPFMQEDVNDAPPASFQSNVADEPPKLDISIDEEEMPEPVNQRVDVSDGNTEIVEFDEEEYTQTQSKSSKIS